MSLYIKFNKSIFPFIILLVILFIIKSINELFLIGKSVIFSSVNISSIAVLIIILLSIVEFSLIVLLLANVSVISTSFSFLYSFDLLSTIVLTSKVCSLNNVLLIIESLIVDGSIISVS